MTDSVFKVNLAHLGGVPVLGRLTAGLRRWRDRNAALREFERLERDELILSRRGFPTRDVF